MYKRNALLLALSDILLMFVNVRHGYAISKVIAPWVCATRTSARCAWPGSLPAVSNSRVFAALARILQANFGLDVEAEPQCSP